jgi:hypothetical protein
MSRHPDPLQRLFERAQDDGLGSGQLEELWSRLGPAVLSGTTHAGGGGETGPGASGAAGGSTAVAGAGFGLKTVAVLLVGGALAAVGISQPWRSRPASAPITVAVSSPDPARGAVGPAAAPIVPEAPRQPVDLSALPQVPSPLRSMSRARSAAGSEGRPVDRAPARQFGADDTAGSGRPSLNAADSPPAAGWSGSNSVAAPGEGPVGAARDPNDAPGSASTPSAPSPSEGALLLRARQELASNPSGALALTEEHVRRFPSGSLVPEREVLAIEALARLGRVSEARARLAAFRDRFPQSPHLAHLDALVNR